MFSSLLNTTILLFKQQQEVERQSLNISAHMVVTCVKRALQVSIGNPEKMEPITNVSHIPSNRWALICCLCKEKAGACIQVASLLTFLSHRREDR